MYSNGSVSSKKAESQNKSVLRACQGCACDVQIGLFINKPRMLAGWLRPASRLEAWQRKSPQRLRPSVQPPSPLKSQQDDSLTPRCANSDVQGCENTTPPSLSSMESGLSQSSPDNPWIPYISACECAGVCMWYDHRHTTPLGFALVL